MTNTTLNPANAEMIQNAALLAAVELLLAPEFSEEWIREMSVAAGFDATDENVETVITALMAHNRVAAAPLIAALPRDLREPYLK